MSTYNPKSRLDAAFERVMENAITGDRAGLDVASEKFARNWDFLQVVVPPILNLMS